MSPNNLPVIILENPKYAGNIGMICRLIGNFSLSPLRIIGEKKELQFDMEWMAYNAKIELEKIEYISSINQAAEDLDILIGTGMIHGKDRAEFLPLSELTNKTKGKSYGVIFGREDRGLSRESISYCDYMLDFNLPGYQKSMNLSHSVAYVISYFQINHEVIFSDPSLTVRRDTRKFYEYSKKIFSILEMDNFHNLENLANRRFKSIIERANPNPGDIDFFFKIFQQIEKLDKKKRIKNTKDEAEN